MLKKVFKNLYCLGLMLLAVGLVLFMPSFVNRHLKEQEVGVQTVSAVPDSGVWMEEMAAGATNSDILGGQSFYGQTNVYFIYTAVGLANVAYHVNSGTAGYSTATYVLANDIDLDGAIWTPIGTSSHPFSGVFLGEGHTISNITVDSDFADTNATSGRGLFGNITNASISDLIISGEFSSSGTSSTHIGALVGRATNSIIIACRDNTTGTYTSVGSTSGTVQVFSSSAYASTNISGGSITSAGVTETSTLGVIDGTGITETGHAVYYYDTNAIFYRNDTTLPDGNGHRLRVLTNTNYTNFSGTLIKSNPLFLTRLVVLRENLAVTDTSVPYSIREGYMPSYETPSDTNCYINITFSTPEVAVTFDMGYGSRTNVSVSIPYDTTISDFLSGKTYNQRLGYTLDSITTPRGDINANPDFYYAYPKTGDTVSFSWIAGSGNRFYFRFLMDNTDYEIGGFNYASLSGAISGVSATNGTLNTSALTNESGEFRHTYSVDNISSGNSVTVSFVLDAGYEIAIESGTNLVVNSNDAQNILSSNGNSSDVFMTTSGTNPTSGVYLSFANFTGVDPNYTVTNRNNDSYNEVTASGTVANQSGSGAIDIREKRVYTITISNVVANSGSVYFVVKRASQTMTVRTVVSALNEQNYNSFTWSHSGDWNYDSENPREFTVNVRLGQTVELTININREIGYYVLSSTTGDSAISFSQNGNSSSGGVITVLNPDGETTTSFYQNVTFTGTITSMLDGLTLTVGIGGINSRFKFEVGTMNGNTFSAINFNADDNTTLGFSGTVNTTPVGLNSVSLAPINDISSDSTDSISLTTNGYYVPTRLYVERLNQETGEYVNIVDVATTNENYFTINGNVYTWEILSASDNIFNVVYGGIDNVVRDVDYRIRFVVEEASYSLDWENFVFNINGDTYRGDNEANLPFLQSLFSFSEQSFGSFKPNDNVTVTLQLSEVGRAILYGETSSFSPNNIISRDAVNDDVDGYQPVVVNSTSTNQVDSGIWSFTFTAGTYDFKFEFNFDYKEIDINAIGMVLENGSVIPSTNEMFVGSSSTYRYSYDGTNVSLVSVSGNASFGSIQIHTQYYMLGWYLQNGVTTSTNYNYIYQADNFLESYQNSTRASNTSTFSIDVYAMVTPRTISISYDAGVIGKGELVTGDNSSDELSYTTPITLKSPYRNKGYTFNVWTYTIGTSNLTANSGATFAITGTNWSTLFNNTGMLQSWNQFGVDADTIGDVNEYSKNSFLTLTATWSIINYNLSVDGNITRNEALQIGDEIRYVSNDSKNGGGVYYIYRDGAQSSYFNGGTIAGYISNGFTISYDGEESATIETVGSDRYASIIFDDEIFDNLMQENYDTPNLTLDITTDRYEAPYKVYIESSDYYDVTIVTPGEGYGQDENGVYVDVTYNKIPTSLDKNSGDFLFGEGGAISITRNGYDFTGDFYGFDPTTAYLNTRDITISPIWVRNDEETSSSNIEFADEVEEPIFYLLNSYDIITGSVLDLGITSGDNTVYFENANEILSNGDQIISYGFVVTYGGEPTTYENIVKFNINNLYKEGEYSIYFYINMEDSLYNSNENPTYYLQSSPLTFEMRKNDFTFTGNFVSAYNGTNEFVPTLVEDGYALVNDFGNVYLTYDWNGEEKLSPTEFNTTNFFTTFVLGGSDYNVGEDKDLLLTINRNYFSSVTNINGVAVNTSTNWADLIENVTNNSETYTYNYAGGATIVRARFVIDFGESSTYYFDGVTLIVYTHNNGAVPFNIGNNGYFEWNLDRIIYNGSAVSVDTVFTGAEDSDVFTLIGLTINDEEYNDNMDRNFEYVLEGEFTLYNSDSALKQSYSPRYMTAVNGELVSSLGTDYAGISDNLYIGDVMVGGQPVSVTGSQFTYQTVDNIVVFSVVNNGTTDLQIYINRDMISLGISYNIYIDINNDRLSHLTPLAWGESEVVADYESYLDSDFTDPSTGSDPYNEYTITGALTNTRYYAVLTDVVKLSFNYNGGHNSDNEGNEIIYLSYSDGSYELANPTIDYAGIDFLEYSYLSSEISVIPGENSTVFSNTDGGQSVTLVAYWQLNDIVYSEKETEFDYYASLSALELDVNDVISYTSFNSGVYTFTITKNDDESVVFTASGEDIFTIMDETNRAPITLDGDYTFRITFVYTNSFQGEQIKEEEFNITINVSLNDIGIEDATNPSLTFNNADRKDDIKLGLRQNGAVAEVLSLNGLISTGLAKYGVETSITQGSSPITSVVNAGRYNITITLNSDYSNFFRIETGRDSISLDIAQYQFDLADYSDQIEIFKLIGQDDPSPITDTITITDNLVNQDEVEINFTREEGEAVGGYDYLTATLANSLDRTNYILVFSTIDSQFEIRVPESNLQIELDGTLAYIYNGSAIELISARYNSGENAFEIYGMAGEEEVSQTFRLFYTYGGREVDIPLSQRELYATYLAFTIGEGNSKNVGLYGFTVSLSQAGEDAGWPGVEFTQASLSAGYNQIEITKRTITVASASKVFDQSMNFTYTNTLSNQTVNFVLENTVQGDTITLTGRTASEVVGLRAITTLTLDSTSDHNYTIVYSQPMTINPSQETVVTETDVRSLVYGILSQNDGIAYILENIPLEFSTSGVSINGMYIEVSNPIYTNGSFSTGNFLEVGTRNIQFTLSSINYTFRQDIGSIGQSYQTTVNFNIEITKLAITIENSSHDITKVYDGDNLIDATNLNQNVNASLSPYLSSGILTGDVITIVGGQYNNEAIGDNKAITLLTFAENDDSSNYRITYPTLVGSITDIRLTFNKDYDTYDFVDDGQNFTNTQSITVEYTGNVDNDVIATLLLKENFVVRRGYTQIGWTYQGETVSTAMTNKADLLQDAVDAGTIGITLQAVWQINEYEIKVVTNNSTITPNISTVTRQYWSSLNSDLINVTANEGYTFEGVSLDIDNGTIVQNVNHTSTGTFNINNIIGDMTVTIDTEEIEIRIMVNYNNPEGYSVSTTTLNWINNNNRVLSYSQLTSEDLPVIDVDRLHTYDFGYWTVGEEQSTGTSGSTNIWNRIKELFGTPTQDNLAGYTFTANWIEETVNLTIRDAQHSTITVYKDSVADENIVTGQGGVYEVTYNDNLIIDIQGEDWYKWTGFVIGQDYTSLAGDTTPTQTTDGQFSLQIKGQLEITLSMEEIEVSVLTTYTTPLESQVTQAVGSLDKTYSISDGDASVQNFIGVYTATAGTYYQDGWANGDNTFALTDTIKNIIIALIGIPTEDSEITIDAVWQGETYTLSFVKNNNDAVWQDNVEDTEVGQEVIVRKYVYGDVLTDLPLPFQDGKYHVWENSYGETIDEGMPFTTNYPTDRLQMTYTAEWIDIAYVITVNYTGIENEDKINGVTYSFTGEPYPSGGTGNETAYYGQNRDFVFDLAVGYEIDIENTIADHPEFVTLSRFGNTYTLRLGNITGDVNVTVAIKAKDYTITISQSQYETISETSLAVSYDQNILDMFNALTFTRTGYTIEYLYVGNNLFATYADGSWTFSESYVQNNLYKTDSNLTLKPVYKADGDYVEIVTSPVGGLIFNADLQNLANTIVESLEDETSFVEGLTLENGDIVVEFYYTLNGERVDSQANFDLLYRNAVINGKLTFSIVLRDGLSLDGRTTYTYTGSEVTVTLDKSDILTENANIVSYYSGTSSFYPSEEEGNVNAYGNMTYEYGNAVSELLLNRVEFVDESGNFNVGSGHSIVYYLEVSGQEFDVNNYNNLVKDADSNLYIYTVTDITGQIIPAHVTFEFSEQGFYNGQRQYVTGNVNIILQDWNTRFTVTLHSLLTIDIAEGLYDSADRFEIDSDITLDGQDKESNFIYLISGGYEIIGTDASYQVRTGAKYLNVDNSSVDDETSLNTTITSFNFAGATINISGQSYNYMVSGELIFSITDNGTYAPTIIVANDREVSFTFSVDGEMAVLDWVTSIQYASLINTLNNLTMQDSRSITQRFIQSAQFYPVVTDYKAVLMSLGDKGGDQGYLYVKLGSSKTAQVPQWTGFDFMSWRTLGSTVTAQGNGIFASANAGITTTTITAIWEIATPVAEVENETIVRSAKVEFNAVTDEISVEDIIGENGITNENPQDINYSYTWFRDGSMLGFGSTLTVPANTTSNGQYTLSITASRTGYASKSLSLQFNISITKLDIGEITINETEFIYSNTNYIPQINFTIGTIGQVNLEDILDAQDSSNFYFTLSGVSTIEIRQAGEYTLTLGLNETVFNSSAYSVQVNVDTYSYTITSDDIPSDLESKLFGLSDPTFTFTKTMFESGNREDIEVTLTREAGESVGTYDFNGVSTTNPNYTLSIQNAIFTISPSDFTLEIVVDSPITMTYDGEQPELSLSYSDEEQRWIISTGESTSTISLYMLNDGERMNMASNLYRLALENISLSYPMAIDVGVYDLANLTVTFGEGANFNEAVTSGQLNINQLGLIISSVTKVFDRTYDINAQGVTFENLVQGDNVTLAGQYDSLLVGTEIQLENLTLRGNGSGDDSANYYIANPEITGSITPLAIDISSLTLNNPNLIYGQVAKNTNANDLISLVGGAVLTLDGITTDLANGYIEFSAFSVEDQYLSSSNYLRAVTVQITITLTSQNFTFDGAGTVTFDATLNISPKELDLSGLNNLIVKEYDETNALPEDFPTNISAYGIMAGDDTYIDSSLSHYEDETIGRDKIVYIILAGEDKDNYTVKNNVYGTINAYTIYFTVNAETESAELVTDGSFVEDGERPVIRDRFFTFTFPNEYSGEELIGELNYPTRKGYRAVGWMVRQGDSYVALTAENIYQILEDVAYDESNEGNTLTIYTVWEIEDYTISVSGQGLQDYIVSGEYYDEDTSTARYFSSLTIDVTGNEGFKVARYTVNGDYVSAVTDDIGQREGTLSIENLGSNIDVIVSLEEIQISIIIDTNIPLYTSRVDSESTYLTYNYSVLATMYENSLPSLEVTLGTYLLDGYTYDNNEISGQSLKEIVDILLPDLNEDSEITLTANWRGVNYIVYFDAGEGSLSGNNPIDAVYGSQFADELPTASLPGRSFVWSDDAGITYNDGDVYRTIGSQSQGAWTTTLHAEYINNPYTLTVQFGDRITVYENGIQVANNGTFTVVYSEDRIVLNIIPDQGYDFVVDDSSLNGECEVTENGVEIYNLVENGSIMITSTPAVNVLTIVTNHIEGYEVYINEELQSTMSPYNVYTESSVEMIFTAIKGYEFDDTSLTYNSGFASTIEYTISPDKKTLTVTWEDFIDDITFTVQAVPSINTITIPDISDRYIAIEFNGVSLDITGDIFEIRSDVDLTVTATLVYGYREGVITSSIPEFLLSQSCTYSRGDGYFHTTANFDNINESFALSFSSTEREYIFSLQVPTSQEGQGTVTVQTTQTVTYGEELTLGATNLLDHYIFAGWEFDGDLIAEEENTVVTIDSSLRDMLESVSDGGTIVIYATFRDRSAPVSFSAGNHGQISFYQADGESTTVNGGRTEIASVRLGENLYVLIEPDDGYELNQIIVDGVPVTEGYDSESGVFTIMLDAIDPITSIEVTFTAGDAYIHVQGVLQVNFEFVYGTDAGGYVYLVDQTGTRLGDENYLNGQDSLYYDYDVLSKTDGVFYLMAEPRSGFTVMMNSPTTGVVISEFTSATGQTIYAVSGVKDGAEVQAIFVAIENQIDIRFVMEGSNEVVDAGLIYVDTSSVLIRASQNNSSNVRVSAITGGVLSVQINTQFTYSLVEENGLLKTRIVYHDGQFDEGTVTIGTVEESNPYANGFTMSSSINVTNVNADATIYIYVQPKVYNLIFYVTEDVQVSMPNSVIYGQTFSLDSLTEQQRAQIFPTRTGYTLGGYYTMQMGRGTQYIDGSGAVIRSWAETGYAWTGYGYEATANYNPQTDTFTIYASWIYDRASISISFRPESVEEGLEDVSIENIITNLGSLEDCWLGQDDIWYTEVSAGSSLRLQAYNYEGYEFAYWLVSYNNEEPSRHPANFEMTFDVGRYDIRAVYQPRFTLNNTEGGRSELVQNGQVVSGESFSPDLPVTLVAYPDDGYTFVYFVDASDNKIYYGTYDENMGGYVYAFEEPISSPLNINVIFEGKPVVINIDDEAIAGIHEIVGVYVDDSQVSYDTSIQAVIGQRLTIVVDKAYGYEITIEGATFTLSTNQQGQYEYSLVLNAVDMIEEENGYELNISLGAERQTINLTFEMEVFDAISTSEINRAGSLSFVDASGVIHNLANGDTYRIIYGDLVVLRIYLLSNYTISDVVIYQGENELSILSMLVNNQLTINQAFLDLYSEYNLTIKVVYSRLLWTDDGYRANRLVGAGTEDSPYFVRNREELAFVAYAVNAGLSNEDGLLYSEAVYQLVADINLSGRFWVPIGTHENPFNGTMHLDSYDISGLTLYRDYSNPDTSYGGLFWVLGENAQILQDTATLVIVLVVVGVIILLLLLLLLLLLFLRKRRKKKMDEIANN